MGSYRFRPALGVCFFLGIALGIFITQNKYMYVYRDAPSSPSQSAPASKIDDTPVDIIEDVRNGQISALDSSLLHHLRRAWIYAPSKRPLALANPNKTHYSQVGQSELVDMILKQRQNGFFVEVGALDGEVFSNSLYFERSRNWTGLLIEADPIRFKELLKRHRRAYISNACLATGNTPKMVEFTVTSVAGRSGINTNSKQGLYQREVQSFPIQSLLAAIGQNHVDYFSLDIEGTEIRVLQTFPWDSVRVDVWSIEVQPGLRSRRTPQLVKIFNKTGLYRDLYKTQGALDLIFVRKDVPI